MKLLYRKNTNFNKNTIIKHSDNSFGTVNDVFFDYQVYLTENRSIILNFDTFSKKCVSCEGYLVFNKKVQYKNIEIETYNEGELIIELIDSEKERYCCDYTIKNMIYDSQKSRICLGEINHNEIIKFGIGQYASFKTGVLIGIILDFL